MSGIGQFISDGRLAHFSEHNPIVSRTTLGSELSILLTDICNQKRLLFLRKKSRQDYCCSGKFPKQKCKC